VRIVFAVSVLFLCALCPRVMAGEVYFMPLHFETYLPVTKENIAPSGIKPCALEKVGTLQAVIDASSKTQDKFSDFRVRVKIVESEKSVFIDANGVIDGDLNGLKIEESSLVTILGAHSHCGFGVNARK